MSDLDKALAYTFKNEGGFSNVPQDHGGATSGFGITMRELAKWRQTPVSVNDVRNMKADEARSIYEAWYWKPLSCDKITDDNVATAMFDIGVVRGIGVPPKYAQLICNAHGSALVVDKHIGPLTLQAVNDLNSITFIKDFAAMAEGGFRAIVKNNPSQRIFLNGWINRAHRLLTLI